MKKLLVLLMVVVSMLALAGCGGAGSAIKGGNIIKDDGALVKIMDEFKNLNGLKGKDIMVFQDVSIYTGQGGNRVLIKILKPGTKEDIDQYEYKNGWSGPKPVQITGKGDMAYNLIPLSKLDFAKVPVMYKTMEEKLKGAGAEGAKIDDYFLFRFWQGKWKGSLDAKSDRAKFSAEFELNGNLKEFRKR